jgi:hypothetical membrane protein
MDARKIIGALLFVGTTQFIALLTVAETQYPGYSVSLNYISDLGVWSQPSAYIFNPSVILSGIMTLAAGYLIFARLGWRSQGALFCIAGLGEVGVGFFNELTGAPHILFAFMAFVGGALAGMMLKRRLKGLMGYFGLVFGIVSLLSLILLGTGIWLGLGPGGMERMIMYPQLAFSMALGGYFLAGQNDDK